MGVEAIVKELSNYYVKRRLDDGTYKFYSLASKDSLEGRKAVLKDVESEDLIEEIKTNSSCTEISDEEFKSLLLKAISQLPFENQFTVFCLP